MEQKGHKQRVQRKETKIGQRKRTKKYDMDEKDRGKNTRMIQRNN